MSQIREKSCFEANNWRVQKRDGGKIYLDFWSQCSEEESESHGFTAQNGKMVGSSAYFKRTSVVLNLSEKTKHDVWVARDVDGSTYKLLYGNMFSNKKYPVQDKETADKLLNQLVEEK